MTRGIHWRRLGGATLALVLLSGCGEQGGSRALAAFGTAQRVIAGVGTDTSVSEGRAIPGGFAPEAVAADLGAYRFVQINALGLAETARVIQENGPEVTVAFQSGPTAAFDSDILVATRGLGDDLMTMDSTGLVPVLQAGGGSLTRRMEILDDQDQIDVQVFACTVSAAGAEEVNLGIRTITAQRMDEHCASPAIIFDNIYWLDGGQIVSSRQYVSPSVAYLRVNRL